MYLYSDRCMNLFDEAKEELIGLLKTNPDFNLSSHICDFDIIFKNLDGEAEYGLVENIYMENNKVIVKVRLDSGQLISENFCPSMFDLASLLQLVDEVKCLVNLSEHE